MLKNLLSIFFLSAIFTSVFWYVGLQIQNKENFISPLPDFLRLDKNDQATLLDFWIPLFGKNSDTAYDINALTAKSILIYDLTESKPIFEKKPKTRLPMASLTKIMTAVIALENKKTDDAYIVKNENLVGEDSMGLVAGEKLSLEELLYGLLLPSGNDAAEVLASNYPGGRAAFIKAMNNKAKVIGSTDTRFSNPSGLQGDGTQYTTAYDLLVITKYALDNFPIFAQIVSTPGFEIPETPTHKAYSLYNETNLLTTYPGVKGIKTGYTPEAGLCLVTYLDYSGHKIIGIILNSENRRAEMKELLDHALETIGIQPPVYTG